MLIAKTMNLLGSFILPVLVWQTYWFSNIYASNILNFLIVSLFIISVVCCLTLQYIPEETKLEIKIKRRKFRFNNKTLDYLIKCLDWGVIVTFIGFGNYINAILLLISVGCIYIYKEELNKV
jgi:hypothetical protein